MYYVPGNHDIPLGKNRYFSPQARKRYIEHFGETNMAVPIANHTLILLDAIRLVEEDYRRYHAEMQFGEWRGIDNGVIEFVKLLGKGAFVWLHSGQVLMRFRAPSIANPRVTYPSRSLGDNKLWAAS